MTDLEDRVIKTLAYYKALGVKALTLVELNRYIDREVADTSLFEIQKTLQFLAEKKIICKKNGFWALGSDSKNFIAREKNSKHTAIKWKKLKYRSRFLPYIPYVRQVAITGSVATSSADSDSDIDIIIKTAQGHIWSVRFFTTLIAQILGLRRYGGNIKDRLCFNHYMDENENFGPSNINKTIKDTHMIVWETSTSKKIGGKDENSPNVSIFALKTNTGLMLIKKIIESTLDITLVGRLIEIILAKAQILKIKSNVTPYPQMLPRPSINSTNLIFFYPRVLETEKEYATILRKINIKR